MTITITWDDLFAGLILAIVIVPCIVWMVRVSEK
jgi:hypothetical protein